MKSASFSILAALILAAGVSCERIASSSLAGTRWLAVSIEDAVSTRSAVGAYLLEFGDGDIWSIELDVNTCNSVFSLGGGSRIDFTTPGCSKACCDSQFAEDMLRILDAADRYQLRNGRLILQAGGETLTFRRCATPGCR
ncbi:MAG: META domain-containing protein [Bacteroidia bacterium]|nr:META domain-containing protein [Bacteroidia bacterium]